MTFGSVRFRLFALACVIYLIAACLYSIWYWGGEVWGW